MRLPIGYDNFRTIIDEKLDFVDKTLFIKEIIDDTATAVTLITRPRRFGKTLNLSMLQHFLAAEVYGQKTYGMFDGLKIMDAGLNYMQHQGKYPVIFLTFKDVKDDNFDTAYTGLRRVISILYREHRYLLDSRHLDEIDKERYQSVLRGTADEDIIKTSLQDLSQYLASHHGVKPWLLIDEYDTPIHASFQHGYYEEMVGFMRNLLGAALKTNPYLKKAVITGILRVSKESLFSGLNNLKVYSILQERYSQYFGFTEDEMDELLQQSNLIAQAEEIKKWYNGYQFGNSILYNPWSIANCLNEQGKLRPYWVNTSDNALIKGLFAHSDEETKMMLESLIQNVPIQAMVDEYMAFTDFSENPDALWSLLLSSGYIKALSCEQAGSKLNCLLLPPNYEVSLVYSELVKEWLTDRIGSQGYQRFIQTLLKGNIDDFTEMLKKYLIETLSVFDVTGNNPEKFYHGFVLGLISSTMETHLIKSNHESGYGRYDVMVIPKDLTQPDAVGLILEFKVAKKDEDLNASAKEALQQIEKRHYETEIKQAGITNIIKIGLAFSGKYVDVAYVSTNAAIK